MIIVSSIRFPWSNSILLLKYSFSNLTVSWSPQLAWTCHLCHLSLATVNQAHDGCPKWNLNSRDPNKRPADPMGPFWILNRAGIQRLLPIVQGHHEDDEENHRAEKDPTDLGEDHGLRSDHESDVFGEVLVAVDPHDAYDLPQSDPENSETGSVGVHQVEDVLTIGGHTRKTQEEARKTPDGSHLHFVLP